MAAPTTGARQRTGRAWFWLAGFALAYGILHHQGFVLGRLGLVGDSGTRWADWFDLATPFLIVLPAATALWHTQAGRREWLVFAVGAIAYVEGHGIHLSANSIANLGTEDGTTADVTFLWDEIVGHFVWYGGLSVMCAACVLAFRDLPGPATHGRAMVGLVGLSLLFGTTYATNSLEGHFGAPALVVSMGFVVWAARHLTSAGRSAPPHPTLIMTLVAFGSALFLVGFYGMWHRGFPDPTSVGWNLLAR